MKEKIEMIKKVAKQKIESITTLQELQELKVKYLGKKGELTSILKGLGGLSAEERPKIGSMVNQVRDELEKSIENAEKVMKSKALEQKLEKEKKNVQPIWWKMFVGEEDHLRKDVITLKRRVREDGEAQRK